MKELGVALWRLLRVALALGGTTFFAGLFNIPQLVWVTPIISAVFKAIRDKYPGATWIPL